jgi:hypothetical protein
MFEAAAVVCQTVRSQPGLETIVCDRTRTCSTDGTSPGSHSTLMQGVLATPTDCGASAGIASRQDAHRVLQECGSPNSNTVSLLAQAIKGR